MRIPQILAIAAVGLPLAAQQDWPRYTGDLGGQQYSRLKQINRSNVTKLKIAWSYDTRPPVAPPAPAVVTPPGSASEPAPVAAPKPSPPRNRSSYATPLVAGGVMYLTTPYGRLVALEPETGKKLWDVAIDTPASRGFSHFPGGDGMPAQIIV